MNLPTSISNLALARSGQINISPEVSTKELAVVMQKKADVIHGTEVDDMENRGVAVRVLYEPSDGFSNENEEGFLEVVFEDNNRGHDFNGKVNDSYSQEDVDRVFGQTYMKDVREDPDRYFDDLLEDDIPLEVKRYFRERGKELIHHGRGSDAEGKYCHNTSLHDEGEEIDKDFHYELGKVSFVLDEIYEDIESEDRRNFNSRYNYHNIRAVGDDEGEFRGLDAKELKRKTNNSRRGDMRYIFEKEDGNLEYRGLAVHIDGGNGLEWA